MSAAGARAGAISPLLAVVALLAACGFASCTPVSDAAAPASAPGFKPGSTPAAPRHLPDTNQIVRQRRHRGVATHEVWNIIDVSGGTPAPPPPPPGGRARPRIVRAAGDADAAAQQSDASRRRLRATAADGANSKLTSIPVGGCSVTNYNVNVKVGTQNVTVILDSGSGDLAVASSSCDSSCKGIPNLWSTKQEGDEGYMAELTYGSAQARRGVIGEVFDEGVVLGSQPSVNLNLLAITSQDNLLNNVPCIADADYSFDETGILGFGPDTSSQGNNQTIVGLLADKDVPKIFATLLCDEGGLLWMGGYNPSATTSTPLYTPLDNTQGYYLFEIEAIGLGGQNLGLDANSVTWLADTGTNFLVVPQQVADNAATILNPQMEKLSGVSDFFYGQKCITGFSRAQLDDALSPLEFAIPDINGKVTQLTYPASVSYVEVQLFKNGSELFCPNIQPGDASQDGGLNIFSNNLMNQFVLIFDQVNNQLGFADADSSLCPATNAVDTNGAQGPSEAFAPVGALAPLTAGAAPSHAFAPQPLGIAPVRKRSAEPPGSSPAGAPESFGPGPEPTTFAPGPLPFSLAPGPDSSTTTTTPTTSPSSSSGGTTSAAGSASPSPSPASTASPATASSSSSSATTPAPAPSSAAVARGLWTGLLGGAALLAFASQWV